VSLADGPSCPAPSRHEQVLVAHGGGGRLTHRLLESVFLKAFPSPLLHAGHDGAVIEAGGARLAFTTDAYVVSPLEFPGGDIGDLAVNGTVNDLAMCGARPRWLSAAFVLEEGLPLTTLARVAASMQRAAAAAGVELVTGDTKVVARGQGDGIYVTTAGVGVLEHALQIAPASVQSGDAILLSGDLGRHGVAILAHREGLAFETTIESDCAPLHAPVLALLEAGLEVHLLRDLTRGGLASALVEVAESARLTLEVDEPRLPVQDDVRGACELLGLDPCQVANEGRFVCVLPQAQAEQAREILRAHPVSAGAQIVGRVAGSHDHGEVRLHTGLGSTRLLDMLSGEQLPRIC
jgi:hydrogenase expression/formation protein HypE